MEHKLFEPEPKEPRHEYTTLRMWVQTRDKIKRLAKYFDLTMTQFLDSLADQLIKQHGLEEIGDDRHGGEVLEGSSSADSDAGPVEDS